MLKHLLLTCALAAPFIYQSVSAQATFSGPGNTGHFGGNVTDDYVGWNAFTGIDLQIRHDAARPITFWTQSAERMHISSNGNIGIGGVPNLSTRLHIRGVNNTVSGGLRPWMIFGTYMSEFDDNMYVGLKRENTAGGNSKMDAVINWGDDNKGKHWLIA